jgi:hypothetical protein
MLSERTSRSKLPSPYQISKSDGANYHFFFFLWKKDKLVDLDRFQDSFVLLYSSLRQVYRVTTDTSLGGDLYRGKVSYFKI